MYLEANIYIFFQVCPTGVVNEHTFKDIFASYFPQGGKKTFIYLTINVAFVFYPFDMHAIYIHTFDILCYA